MTFLLDPIHRKKGNAAKYPSRFVYQILSERHFAFVSEFLDDESNFSNVIDYRITYPTRKTDILRTSEKICCSSRRMYFVKAQKCYVSRIKVSEDLWPKVAKKTTNNLVIYRTRNCRGAKSCFGVRNGGFGYTRLEVKAGELLATLKSSGNCTSRVQIPLLAQEWQIWTNIGLIELGKAAVVAWPICAFLRKNIHCNFKCL